MATSEGEVWLLTQSQVLLRDGWTRSLLQRFLGEPDERRKVRGYSIPLSLYHPARVENAERLNAFRDAQLRLEKVRARARESNRQRAEELLRRVESLRITVQTMPMDRLIAKAIGHYESRNENADCGVMGAEFLERITVNYIRHCLTRYDHALNGLHGKVGANAAACRLRERVLKCIAIAYPGLAEECERQISDTAY